MSSLLSDLGNMHLVHGTITGSGTDSTLSSNDGSATIAGAAAGDYTVTFGQPFLSAPTVVATVIDATFATTAEYTVAVVAVATDSVQFNAIINTTNGTVTALGDINVSFMAAGLRNN